MREIQKPLLEAKTAILAWRAIPFQKRWINNLQEVRLKAEVWGTTRIENAEFVGDELDQAIRTEAPEQLRTRSQRQAHAAIRAYRWVAQVPDDRPMSTDLIKELHRLIVTGCDDDHCTPGVPRQGDENVIFGSPRHRGVPGGTECENALHRLARHVSTTFRDHDPLVQAIALHYHFAAMHPFLDGNGRTARAIEALALQRAGLKGALFVPMSNFYYSSVSSYLAALAESQRRNHDLTPFLEFALGGLAAEATRAQRTLRDAVSREIFRGFLNELHVRLESTRKRVIVQRQLGLLRHLLDQNAAVEWSRFVTQVLPHYPTRKHPVAAIIRDVSKLHALGAVNIKRNPAERTGDNLISVNLDWPSSVTESEFLERLSPPPKSGNRSFPAVG